MSHEIAVTDISAQDLKFMTLFHDSTHDVARLHNDPILYVLSLFVERAL